MDILVSSTYEDLKDERIAAIEAVDRVERAIRMENFSASTEPSREECLLRLRECDALVLLIGDRYGSIDPKTGYSITELEYRTAEELGLPVFAFLKVGEDKKWRSSEQDEDRLDKHIAFKRLVEAKHTRQDFRTLDELKFEIVAALDLYAKRHGRIGVRGSVFLTLDQFFSKYLDPDRIFNHTFPLVGRHTYIDQLRDVPNLLQKVILLSGAGGMGKSKILQAGLSALQDAHPEATVCFLGEGNTFTSDHAKELPEGKLVIVVDDAHRVTTGLSDLFAFAQSFSERIKLVLSTRPHGLSRLRQELSFAGFDSEQILDLPEVGQLSSTDVETLAAEIVGAEARLRLAQLVSISRDSPLITVIAGQLLARKHLDPALLTMDNSGAFKYGVLSRFEDELVAGKVATQLESSLVRKLLRLVAALTPLNPEQVPLVEHMAKFLKIEPDEVLSALNVLERGGILARRAGMLRIVPDVLSDHILHEACFTDNDQLTGYGKSIIAAVGDLDLSIVLQNMAELDWRVSDGKGTGLLKEVWRDLRASYEAGNHQERLSLLELVAPVSYFQPSEALALARLALHTPLLPDPGSSVILPGAEEHIRHALAPLLRNIAYYPEHFPEAITLLWQIGRDDNRPVAREGDHPVRILQELASYGRYKALGYNEMLFNWLEKLALSADGFQHIHSPLDILPALLKREGTETWSQARKVIIEPFLVDPRKTSTLRGRVLALIQTLGHRNNPAMRRSLVELLVNVAFPGMWGLGSFRPTREHFTVWQSEDRKILEILQDLLVTEDNPMVLVKVEDALLAVQDDPRREAIADDAQRLLQHLPLTLESTLVRYLQQGLIHRRRRTRKHSLTSDVNAIQDAIEQEANETLTTFFATYSKPDEIKGELDRLFSFLADAGTSPPSSYFLLERFCRRAPAAMMEVCDLLVADPESQALECLPVLLTELREYDVEHCISCLRASEESPSPRVRRIGAWALSVPQVPAQDGERWLIKRCALDPDRATSLAGIRALKRFSTEYYQEISDTLAQISIGSDGRLADAVCGLFDPIWGIDPKQMPKRFVSHVLEEMVTLDDWSMLSSVTDFIEWVTLVEPEYAVDYYQKRLAHRRTLSSDQRSGYRSVPHITHIRVKYETDVAEALDARREALRIVRDSTLNVAEKVEIWDFAEIFSRVSQHYVSPALDVLLEWIDSGEDQKVINAALLLQSADSNFVFTDEAYVVHLLEMANAQSPEVYQRASNTLINCARSRVSGGWVGAPDPKDEELRDRAAQVSQRYPVGHVAHDFYGRLNEIAVASINRNMTFWEALDDE